MVDMGHAQRRNPLYHQPHRHFLHHGSHPELPARRKRTARRTEVQLQHF